MAVPQLTHLQFLVLSLIREDPHSGRFIRDRLAEEGAKQSGPAFYQMMARMEESLLLSGWYESFVIDGQTIKERRYQITPKGEHACQATMIFYSLSRSNASQNPSINTSN